MAVNGALVSSADTTDGFLSPANADNHQKHSSSLSISRSRLSNVSHITLVEEDPEFIAEQQTTVDDRMRFDKKKKPLDIILNAISKICCMGIPKERMAEQKVMNRVPTEDFCSPWISDVYVVTAPHDPDNDPASKLARLIIDTGNVQGNIVSRAFVEELGFSESSFRELKEHEKRGGIGITNDKLIPEAAINLTWYHKKGTRVIRDMRFLISPHSHADLIIGARSIETYGFLTVPNFMAALDVPINGGKVAPPKLEGDKKLNELDVQYKRLLEAEEGLKLKIDKANMKKISVLKADETAYKVAILRRKIAGNELLIYKQEPTKSPNAQDPIKKLNTEIEDWKKQLQDLGGDEAEDTTTPSDKKND